MKILISKKIKGKSIAKYYFLKLFSIPILYL